MGVIEFKNQAHGIQARGDISSDGGFELSTYREGDGATEGTHDCVIVQMVVMENLGKHEFTNQGVVHKDCGSYATSSLTCEISATGDNKPTIVVRPIGKATRDTQHNHLNHSGE